MNVAYMFAGVGSVRLAFEYDCAGFSSDSGWSWVKRESSPWNFCWTNQYEPPVKKDRDTQHAYDIYVNHFGYDGTVNADIVKYLDHPDLFDVKLPESIDLLMAGFPCQDFSVANRTREGIEGKKGAMWWEIYRILKSHRPRFVLLENVDNLIRSPSKVPGRDFGLMLASLRDAGYNVEWRVYHASDAGAATSRCRTFVLCTPDDIWGSSRFFFDDAMPGISTFFDFVDLDEDILKVQDGDGYVFHPVGRMIGGRVETYRFRPTGIDYVSLGDVLQDLDVVVRDFPYTIISDDKLDFSSDPREKTWQNVKGNMAFPDPLDAPARTILTKCTEITPFRENIVVSQPRGDAVVDQVSGGDMVYRTITPVEAERIMSFPDGWTEYSVMGKVPRFHRGFVMGNSCPVVVLERIRRSLEALTGRGDSGTLVAPE